MLNQSWRFHCAAFSLEVMEFQRDWFTMTSPWHQVRLGPASGTVSTLTSLSHPVLNMHFWLCYISCHCPKPSLTPDHNLDLLAHHASPAWHSCALQWDWQVLTCPFYSTLDVHNDVLPPKRLPHPWLDLALFCTLVGQAACLVFQNLCFVLLFVWSSLYWGLIPGPQELLLMILDPPPSLWMCPCLVGEEASLDLSHTSPSPIVYDISTLLWVLHPSPHS